MNYPRKKIEISTLFYIIPFGTVFMILLVINSLYSTFVYIPGISVNLSTFKTYAEKFGKPVEENVIRIKMNGMVLYGGREFTQEDFFALLKDKTKGKNVTNLLVTAEQGVSSSLISKITDQLHAVNIAAKYVYNFPDLPAFESTEGLIGSAVFMVIDPNGLFYFQDQAMEEDKFRVALSRTVQKASEPLTLVIMADKSVPYEYIVKASAIAKSAGINRLLFATRPDNRPLFMP